jgi:hypothetical protein
MTEGLARIRQAETRAGAAAELYARVRGSGCTVISMANVAIALEPGD